MTIDEFLKGLKYYYNRQTAIENQEESLKRLKAKLYYPKTSLFERSSGKGNTSDYLTDAMEKQEALEEKLCRNREIQQEIDRILSLLTDEERDIIRRRYMEEEPCCDICKDMHVSRRTLYRRIEGIKEKLMMYF